MDEVGRGSLAGPLVAAAVILERKNLIESHGLEWSAIESLPVHEDIKKESGNYKEYIENYKVSLQNIGKCGIRVVAYNFMQILDCVRTDHFHENEEGAAVLKFDPLKFAYFDLFLLKRKNAEKDYTEEQITAAKKVGDNLSSEEKDELFKSILLGLPGSTENFTAEIIKDLLESYSHINDEKLRKNLVKFLSKVTPTAEESNVNLAIHPDDPPFSVLGLPRVVSNHEDLKFIFENVKSKSNGLCYCTGSLCANPAHDLLEIYDEFEERIHFLHLRNVKKKVTGVFMESNHLDVDVPMLEIVKRMIKTIQKSKNQE